MTKSNTTQVSGGTEQVQKSPPANAANAEAQRTRHRTAIRIAGIEGVDGFADIAEGDVKLHPEKL